ncbi:MAG: acyl-CoA dehydrogenase family protein [Candidatus Binatia bacterium]|nr:acyl-CoA dehydrogenase family protein [Candidatus Binatia bacterium]
MDLRLDATHLELRDSVRAFLREQWREGSSPEKTTAFRAAAVDRGYVYRSIPREFGGAGREPDPVAEDVIQTEFAAAGAPLGLVGEGPDMLAPTLLHHGTDEQRREFIAATLSGDITWCQGYSEPGAGSDLASLTSRAELDGDEWVITGQKIWTSSAHIADWMFALIRTEPDQPRHRGISYLLIPMDQPGVEVRPLKQITGGDEFNQVFLDEARTHVRYTVGERGAGWGISRTTLAHERALIGNPRKALQQFQDLLELARRVDRGGRPAIESADVRQRLLDIEGYLLSQKYTRYRILSAANTNDEQSVEVPMLVSKLHTTEIGKKIVRLAYDLLGADESLRTPDPQFALFGGADRPGGWSAKYLFSHGSALGGGAPNIQRNVIGERALGLPRDIRGSRKP